MILEGEKGKNRTNLSESLRVGAHVCEDDKDVLLTLVSQVLSRRQRQAWGDDALNAVTKR